MPDALALIDYGAGNLRSVENALRAAGAADVRVTADPDVVRRAARIVLPGVGAFAACMGALSAIPGMVDAPADRVVREGIPFLGVCVGMQMLFDGSDESPDVAGLGILPGQVRLLPDTVKRPQMQWNVLDWASPDGSATPMADGQPDPCWRPSPSQESIGGAAIGRALPGSPPRWQGRSARLRGVRACGSARGTFSPKPPLTVTFTPRSRRHR